MHKHIKAKAMLLIIRNVVRHDPISFNVVVAAGFPVFFALVFSRRFLEPYKSSLRRYSICHLFWSDSPEVTATFSRS